MRIGFLTNSLTWVGITDLESIANWAVENGFEDLEVGPTIPMDEAVFNKVLEKDIIKITSLIYCRNFLSSDKHEAEEHLEQLKKRIEFASKIGVEKIVSSTGVDAASFDGIKFNPEASVDKVVDLFKGLAELAEKKNVKLGFENCPMMGNTAISPYMWEILFDRIGSDKMGMTLDPSHLVWQFMDPYESIFKLKDRIFHVHGKDCQINYNMLKQVGILHMFGNTDHTKEGENAQRKMWWRYRLPGLGELDWNRIVANLYEIGYKGTISIEHEDPVWEGSEEKVKKALIRSKEHIQQYFME